jgi:hypothetical protein
MKSSGGCVVQWSGSPVDDDAEQWRAQGSKAGTGKQQGARGTSSSPFIGQEAVAIDDHGDYGRFWKKSEGR